MMAAMMARIFLLLFPSPSRFHMETNFVLPIGDSSRISNLCNLGPGGDEKKDHNPFRRPQGWASPLNTDSFRTRSVRDGPATAPPAGPEAGPPIPTRAPSARDRPRRGLYVIPRATRWKRRKK